MNPLSARAFEIYEQLIALPPNLRTMQLECACGSERQLRAEVERLLAFDKTDPHLRPILDNRNIASFVEGAGAEEQAPLPPKRFGTYEIVGILSHGGSSRVYRALQSTPKREVALKVPRFPFIDDVDRERFRREGNFLARLQHPHICTVFEAGVARADGAVTPFIAMELIDGLPLNQFARETQPNLRRRLEILIDVCRAVQFAHDRGVIHRDLKPMNILVAEIAGRPTPKVLDFGIGQLLKRDDDETRLTRQGGAFGTVGYMSPEQARGENDTLDIRTDIYSLGLIAFELLVGCTPFHKKSLETNNLGRFESIPSARKLNSTISAELAAVIEKAVAFQPARRYQSASQFAEDLRNILEHKPTIAQPDKGFKVAWRWIVAHRVAAAISTTAVLSLAVYSVTVTALLGRARLAETTAATHAGEATKLLRRVQGILDVVFDGLSGLENVPGAGPQRKAILEGAFSHLSEITEEMGESQEAKLCIAKANRRLGELALGFGNRVQATRHFSTFHKLAAELSAQDPQNPEFAALLSIALVKLGDLSRPTTRFSSGEVMAATRIRYEQALAIDERLHRDFPDNAAYSSNLMWSYERLAYASESVGNVREQAQYLTNFQALASEFANKAPGNVDAALNLATSYYHLAWAAWENDDPVASQRYLNLALDTVEPLRSSIRDESRLAILAFGVHGTLMHRALDGTADADAARHLQLAENCVDQLVRLEPTNPLYRDKHLELLTLKQVYADLTGDMPAHIDLCRSRLALCEQFSKDELSSRNLLDRLDSTFALQRALVRANCTEEAELLREEMVDELHNGVEHEPYDPALLSRYFDALTTGHIPTATNWELARTLANRLEQLPEFPKPEAWIRIALCEARLGNCDLAENAARESLQASNPEQTRQFRLRNQWVQEILADCH